MKKFYKFLKSFIFISVWLILTSQLIEYWNIFHYEYIFSKIRIIFDREFWLVLERILFGINIGYRLEYFIEFITYEIPEESFKYIPIYLVLKSIWIKNLNIINERRIF